VDYLIGENKQVLETHIRYQHAVMDGWSSPYIIDSGLLTPEETLTRVTNILETAKIK